MNMKYLENKRKEVLEAIRPICEAFGIRDYDYIVQESGQRERLKLNDVYIGCTANSIDAVINEVIGYIFVTRYCRERSIGAFRTQTLNCVKRYWIKE